MSSTSDIFLALLAILFPPLPVWIKAGFCSCASILNIILSVLGWLPGLLHAWYIIASTPDESAVVYYYEEIRPADLEAGNAGGRVSRIPGPAGQGTPAGGYTAPPPQLGPRHDASTNYGTINHNAGSSAGEHAQVQPEGAPPTYAQAVKGDNKVQK